MNKSIVSIAAILIPAFMTCGNIALFTASAQEIKKVSGSFTYYAHESMPIAEAKRIALESAKAAAIEKAFGRTVSQSISAIEDNSQDNSRFFFHNDSEIKGEWIDTTDKPIYEISYDKNEIIITVSVKGRARELSKNRVPIKVQVLRNGFENRHEDNNFHNGDDLFLAFKSPVAGSLLVYLLDYSTDTAYCLLPYANAKQASYSVSADQPYIFFTPQHAANSEKGYVDEYTLTLSDPAIPEFNDIVVFFSTEELIKGNTEQISSTLPRQMSLDAFEKWKANAQLKSSQIQVIHKPININ